MRTGWLSEAGGEYVLTFMRQVDEPLPDFRRCASVSACRWPARWTVSNLENAECIAGQGELPFKVGVAIRSLRPICATRPGSPRWIIPNRPFAVRWRGSPLRHPENDQPA
jgi:hypothetical protein